MLAAALNLSGLFEIGASLQGLGGGLAGRGGLIGAAFTGALAVVVAAPCTAPFMGPALGFALTQAPAVALAVFLALGLGFAAPFTAAGLQRRPCCRRLPRPGPWMDVFRKALAFPMYGAAAWLAWVLAQQAGAASLAASAGRRRRCWLSPPGCSAPPSAGASVAAARRVRALRPAARRPRWPCAALARRRGPAPAAARGPRPSRRRRCRPSPGVPSALAALRAEDTPVFVNFTAAWCVTCQVNERLALRHGEVAAALQGTGAVYLMADWTNRDADIAQALAEQGRVGVPLYLVYGAAGGAPCCRSS